MKPSSRRSFILRWLPWLILLSLLFFFQADFVYYPLLNVTRLPHALETFGGYWEKPFLERETSSGLHDRGIGLESGSETPECEAWLEEKDKVHYTRDFSTNPIIVGFGEVKVWDTCAVGCDFKGSVSFEGKNKADAIFGLRNENGVESVLRSMESAHYYPDNDIANARKKGVKVVMTTSLNSDVPVGYFSWDEYDMMAQPKNKTQDVLAAAFISNCGGHNFRLEAITKLREHGVSIDSYGACLRNKNGQVQKVETLRDYKFSLAFENSNEDDYVTEKFWQSLVAGTIPVVIGAPNIHDFEPSSNSILHIKTIDDIPAVSKRMLYLANHDDVYDTYLRWKYEGPSDAFKALVDMAVVHSSCRLCIHLGTKLRMQEEKQQKRPCQCTKGLITTYHLYVRERGKFEMESIFLTSSNITLGALYNTIIKKFTSMKYIPIFKSGRPEVIRGGDELKIYRIYPVGMTQREALYSWKFQSDQDLKNYIEKHPCANLEIIFV